MEAQPVPLFPASTDFGRIYDFLYACEGDGTTVTIPFLRDRFFSGNYNAAYVCVNRRWRWFLKCDNNKTSPYVYKVQNIRNYRREYFISANEPGQLQFFYHFVESAKTYDNRVKREAHPQNEIKDSQQPLPMQLVIPYDEPLEEPLFDEDISDDDVPDVAIDPINVLMGEYELSDNQPTLDIPLIESGVQSEDLPEIKLEVENTQSPPRPPTNPILWVILCIIAVIVVGVIVALVLINKRK